MEDYVVNPKGLERHVQLQRIGRILKQKKEKKKQIEEAGQFYREEKERNNTDEEEENYSNLVTLEVKINDERHQIVLNTEGMLNLNQIVDDFCSIHSLNKKDAKIVAEQLMGVFHELMLDYVYEEEDLESDWELFFDEQRHAWYFYNSKKDLSSWNKPKVVINVENIKKHPAS